MNLERFSAANISGYWSVLKNLSVQFVVEVTVSTAARRFAMTPSFALDLGIIQTRLAALIKPGFDVPLADAGSNPGLEQ